MVVGRVLGHVAGQLGDFYYGGQLPLEAGEQDLALRWLEAVYHGRDGAPDVLQL